MTREEIIGGLQFTIDMFLLNPNTGETREDYEINDMDKTTIDACKCAIELLKQEPCEDCISRQKVLNTLFYKSDGNCEVVLNKSLQDRIKALKSVKPQEQKTGHWRIVSDGYGDNAHICECSECKDTVWVYKNADRKWNYCPNCGAKMEEDESSYNYTWSMNEFLSKLRNDDGK